MKIWQIVAISAVSGVSLPALAQMAQGPQVRSEVEARVRERLAAFDANKDGTVTADEMRTAAAERMKARNDTEFTAMDTDKNGSISRAEFDVWHARPHGDVMAWSDRGNMGGHMGGMSSPKSAAGAPKGDGHKGDGHMRMMMMDRRGGGMMAMGDGKGIVIADAVKKALERFDASDTNKDGTLSPEERRAARDSWQGKPGA